MQRIPLDARNDEDALLASGTIPLVCAPVRDIAGAPPGNYWDGALVDYHLMLPYPRLTRAGSHRRRAGLGRRSVGCGSPKRSSWNGRRDV